MVVGGVVCRDGFGLRRIGAPGYRAHSSVAMAIMFKAIRFGRNVSGFKPTCTHCKLLCER